MHFKSFCLVVLQLILASKLSELEQFEKRAENCLFADKIELINSNTTIQNDLKWRKTCTGLKFDLVHFYCPQTKFIVDSL